MAASEIDLLMQNFQRSVTVAENGSCKNIIPFEASRAAELERTGMRPSPFACRICGFRNAAAKYWGDSRWVVTCPRCHESCIVNQGGGRAAT